MSLDDIQLPGWSVASLYFENLIGSNVPIGKISSAEESSTVRFLGNNQKQILFLVQVENCVFLPDQQLGFLTKILEACKINLADVAIVNLAGSVTTLDQIKAQLNPVIIIGFGPGSDLLGFNLPMFQIQTDKTFRYLFAPGLNQLNLDTDESKLLKSKLWVCLKTLFNIG
jgi:hypothetical protein